MKFSDFLDISDKLKKNISNISDYTLFSLKQNQDLK